MILCFNLSQNNTFVCANILLEEPVLGVDILGSGHAPRLRNQYYCSIIVLKDFRLISISRFNSISKIDTMFIVSRLSHSNSLIAIFITIISNSVNAVSLCNLLCQRTGQLFIKITKPVLDLELTESVLFSIFHKPIKSAST